MKPIHIGWDQKTGKEISIPIAALLTHLHLLGATGKGKTTAIHTILHALCSNPLWRPCIILIDLFGMLSQELLLWMSSPLYCPEHVRRRLVYIQGANEDVVPTLNPLTYLTPAECYFKVERATEIILRAWESQDISQMPRLARWTFNAFMAAAQLGLTISDCVHFLFPGSPFHHALLHMLPEMLQAEWMEITSARGGEAIRTLDSSRNRLKPYFESVILRHMFGSVRSTFNVRRFLEEGKIVIIDLAPRGRLSTKLSSTIGGLVINEVIATIRSLVPDVQLPTYLFLDEFQNFVGPDLESALPEMRAMKLNLVLSHQSLAQLKRGDYDMTNLMFVPQNRLAFGVQGLDADILAHEFASLTYDENQIKDERWSRRQLVRGHRILELASWSESHGLANQWSETTGMSFGQSSGESRRAYSVVEPIISTGQQRSESSGASAGRSDSFSHSTGIHQALVPEYDQFVELAARSFRAFAEHKSIWGREFRQLHTGKALLSLVNDNQVYRINVKRSTPGYLAYDLQTIKKRFPGAWDRKEELVQANFQSEFFVPAATVEREIEERLDRLLGTPLVINAPHNADEVPLTATPQEKTPFDT